MVCFYFVLGFGVGIFVVVDWVSDIGVDGYCDCS